MYELDLDEIPDYEDFPSFVADVTDDDIDMVKEIIATTPFDTPKKNLALGEQLRTMKLQSPKALMALKYIAYSLMIAYYLLMVSTFIAQKVAAVRESPSSSAPVINNITINQHFHVISSVQYYYKIEYQDHETHEFVQGYLYKNVGKSVTELFFDSATLEPPMSCELQTGYLEDGIMDNCEQ